MFSQPKILLFGSTTDNQKMVMCIQIFGGRFEPKFGGTYLNSNTLRFNSISPNKIKTWCSLNWSMWVQSMAKSNWCLPIKIYKMPTVDAAQLTSALSLATIYLLLVSVCISYIKSRSRSGMTGDKKTGVWGNANFGWLVSLFENRISENIAAAKTTN